MNNSNKIAIISSSLNGQKTGVAWYLHNLIWQCGKIGGNAEYHLINCKKEYSEFPFGNISNEKGLFFKKESFVVNLLNDLSVAFKARPRKFDLVFNPCHAMTYFYFSIPCVVLVFDLTPVLFRDTHSVQSNFVHKYILPRTLRNADKIIAISQNTKNDLIKHFNIPEDKIRVVYLAVNNNYKPVSNEEVKRVKDKYNPNSPFILYVGTLEPRKNIVRLIDAFHRLKQKEIPHKLVIAGKKGWKYENIFGEIEKLKLKDDVIFTGYVSDEDLPALYNAADLFVYPSIYEGFGLPPLEAMACGTPVITSNTSSLPEVVGGAGIMVDPYNIDELSNKMQEVLTSKNLRKELSEKGLKRAKMFSWEKCAKETLEVFEDLINKKK
jgi:glycosyltransferase involved in cell wall biosynthesis